MNGRGGVAERAGGVALGLVLDRLLGEPPSAVHPVVWFGRAMTGMEQRCWADRRGAGVVHAAVGVGLGVGAGLLLRRLAGERAVPVAVAVAVAGRSLRRTAEGVEQLLLAGDLPGARAALPALVGRDPSALDASGVSAAVVESLAENTVDAVVAPALWGLVAGAPGVLAYRAVNTMDAMVGHHSGRYEHYGWASARLDDAANLAAARLLAVLLAVVRCGTAGRVLRLVRRDAPAHPSPNAGVAETAVAAVLGVELGGRLRYGDRVEDRPRLGEGRRPVPADITAARALTDDAERALVALLLVLAATARPSGRQR